MSSAVAVAAGVVARTAMVAPAVMAATTITPAKALRVVLGAAAVGVVAAEAEPMWAMGETRKLLAEPAPQQERMEGIIQTPALNLNVRQVMEVLPTVITAAKAAMVATPFTQRTATKALKMYISRLDREATAATADTTPPATKEEREVPSISR
jgi:hypothetical protein